MKKTITIGRAPENDIVLDFPQVSTNHARFTPDGDGFWVEDMGSTNGTFVNGRQIRQAARVTFSDKISLGSLPFSMDNLRPEILQKVSAHKGPAFSASAPYKKFSIGRTPGNDIALDYPQVSGNHAEVSIQGGQYFIRDLNSRNGTFVNGQRITESAFNLSDEIRFGSFRFDVNMLAAVAAPSPVPSPPPPLPMPTPAKPPGRATIFQMVQGVVSGVKQEHDAKAEKLKGRVYAMIFSVVLLFAAAGGGTYYYLNQKAEKASEDNLAKIDDLNQKVEKASADRGADIYEKYSKSIFFIYCKRGDGTAYSGTGFAVKKDIIATNAHVTEAWDRSVRCIAFQNAAEGKNYKIKERYAHPAYRTAPGLPPDVGFLVVEGNDLSPVKIASDKYLDSLGGEQDSLRGGQQIITIGFPGDAEVDVNKPIASFSPGAIGRLLPESNYIQHTAAVTHGTSGSPVFNLAGELIGVNQGGIEKKLTTETEDISIKEADGLNFAVNAKVLKKFLDEKFGK